MAQAAWRPAGGCVSCYIEGDSELLARSLTHKVSGTHLWQQLLDGLQEAVSAATLRVTLTSAQRLLESAREAGNIHCSGEGLHRVNQGRTCGTGCLTACRRLVIQPTNWGSCSSSAGMPM